MLGGSSIKYIQIGFIIRLLLTAIILELPINYHLKINIMLYIIIFRTI